MNVHKRFLQYIAENKLFTSANKLLVTVSGGMDSMLLLTLLHELGYAIEVAHCNFQLRGSESDGDEELVRSYAAKLDIPIHVAHFDTQQYANEHKISIQMAARALRYQWFDALATANGLDFIAVAQHKNDHIETVLLNLVRGTGLQGLLGIQTKRKENNIVRPLLFLERAEVEELVKELNIPYRHDSSNFSTKYARNKIRLDIVPQFQALNAEFVETMNENISRFQESADVLHEFIKELRDRIFIKVDSGRFEIILDELKSLSIGKLFLLFEPFGFSKAVLEDLKNALSQESGRLFYSDSYVILLDRNKIMLSPIISTPESVNINSDDVKINWGRYIFQIQTSTEVSIEKDSCIAKIDLSKIVFPLTIRSWQQGDTFRPLGMTGTKKVSDLFIQRKVNVLDKMNVPILVNGNGDIIWIVGIQMDDRYKIIENTQKVLKLVATK